MKVTDLPLVNASLNAASGVLILIAYIFIKNRMIRAHAALMISAVLCSIMFLTCYVIYHVSVPPKSIGLPSGLLKISYLTMLFTHVVLAVVVLPMIVMVVWRAAHRDWVRHKRLARPTFWIWLYVSVTGVVIYAVLYHVVPAMYPTNG